jgi:UDP-glucose 4-epimerase
VKTLVTGGSGFLGSAVTAELSARGHAPVVFDRHARARDFEVILGDVRDPAAVSEAIAHVDAVIHLAGVLGTAETIANPRPAAETNILGGLNVLEGCSQHRALLVNIAVGNWFEHSTYAITKTAVERFVTMYARFRDLHACSLRAFNAFGPGQSLAQPYGTSRVRKMIPSFIARALHGQPIEVYGDGSQVMDMIYVTDVARCLVTALENGPSGGTVYAAGTGRRTTVADIAKAVQAEVKQQTGTAVAIEHLPMRRGETPGSEVLADPEQVRALGIDPDEFTTLEDGLRETVAHYRDLFPQAVMAA